MCNGIHETTTLGQALIVTPVCGTQTAKVEAVNGHFGYIRFVIPEPYHAKVCTKNGATRIPQNTGKLFFHETQVSGPLSALKPNDTVSFSVIHNKKTNKYIATKIYKEATPKPTIPTTTVTLVAKNQTGIIEKMVNHGGKIIYSVPMDFHKRVITKNGALNFPENNGSVAFHETALVGSILSEFKVGDSVSFDVMHNKKSNRYVASKMEKVNDKVFTSTSSKPVKSINAIHSQLKNPIYNIEKRRMADLKRFDVRTTGRR